MARIAQQLIQEPCPSCSNVTAVVIDIDGNEQNPHKDCEACGGRRFVTIIIQVPVEE